MISDEQIKEQIPLALKDTQFGEKYKGKVRDCYTKDDKIVMIATDRVSAFDVVLGTIPFKGQVLNQLAVSWFKKTEDICQNHIISVPDPNVMVVKKCEPLKVEMIVRGYIAGSLWRDYSAGKKVYGLEFPEGLKKNQAFDSPIITPSTKADQGEHDEPISREEIIAQGLVSEEMYKELERISVELYKRGAELCLKQGLILVDTKYEFGLDSEGKLTVMDEIHTPDSSRFWFAADYQSRFDAGEAQNQLSKEHLREWLMAKGFSGDGDAPELDDEIQVEVAKRYIEVFEQITGDEFVGDVGDVNARVEGNVKEFL